ALRDTLSRKGLGADVIERAVAQIDRDDEEARADDLVARRRRSLQGVSRQTAYRRLASMLARKGYSPSVASAAVSRALASWESEEAAQEEPWDTP
ncbi:MAG: regulatory protein RecX, partial [Pauljensenia sp.]